MLLQGQLQKTDVNLAGNNLSGIQVHDARLAA